MLLADGGSGRVIVANCSLPPRFAGNDNPLFYAANTQMFFADAKAALEDSSSALKSLSGSTCEPGWVR